MLVLQRIHIILILSWKLGIQCSPSACHKNQACIPLSKCRLEDSSSLIYPCHSGLNLVCCPSGSYDVATAVENRKTGLFPVNCGVVITSDKISGGDEADLGQFPWMALLGYRQRLVNYTQFLCGGSIITENFVLTAAHCLSLDKRLELVIVRFGEHNLLTDIDCIDKTCADPYVENTVERIIPHPDFQKEKMYHDIALIKVREKIKFTDYIKPICMPFERNLEKKDLALQTLIVSGWGKTNSANLGGSTILQFALVKVWEQNICSNSVPPDVKPIRNSQLCANGEKTEDACKGDSGGPLINSTRDLDGDMRYFQLGVVSFASTVTCGNAKLPTVYTRVDKYLKWIVDNVV